MSDDPCFLSATELRRRISRKEISPVEVTRAVLARAERLQPELNCFITLCADEALAQAKDAERRIMAGEPLGLLDGIPVHRQRTSSTPRPCARPSGPFRTSDNVPDHDAVAVARLRAAGAILIGKTTTPEFGTKCLTDSPLFGRTRNAWSAERSSGGSSGGAAVAVASGIAPLAVATDGGGSTRIPAACNGVVGLKQSNGVIPHSQVQDAFGNQTYVTPMTRTVADTALMMQAMAGEDASDPWSIGIPAAGFHRRRRAAWRPARQANSVLPQPRRPQGFRRCRRGIQAEPENARSARCRTARRCRATALTSSRSGAPSITPPGGPGLKSSRPSIAMS